MPSILDLVRPSLTDRVTGIQNQALGQLGREARRTVNASAARSNANPTALARAGARAASDAQGQVATQFAQQRLAAEEADRNRKDAVLNALMGSGAGLLMSLIPGAQAAKPVASAVGVPTGQAGGVGAGQGMLQSLMGATSTVRPTGLPSWMSGDPTAGVGAAPAAVQEHTPQVLEHPAAALSHGPGVAQAPAPTDQEAANVAALRQLRQREGLQPVSQEQANLADLARIRQQNNLQPVADPLSGIQVTLPAGQVTLSADDLLRQILSGAY